MSSLGEEGKASWGKPGAGTVQLLRRTRHTRQRAALATSALAYGTLPTASLRDTSDIFGKKFFYMQDCQHGRCFTC